MSLSGRIFKICYCILAEMKDYLIVGQGLAGSLIAYELQRSGAEIQIIDYPHESSSSRVAAGLYNPVTGKRKVKTWLADVLFPYLEPYYSNLESVLDAKFLYPKPIYKPYQDVGDQNDLISKSTSDQLGPYLNTKFDSATYDAFIHNEFGGIEVLQSGNVRVKDMLDAFISYFDQLGCLKQEVFDYDALEVEDHYVAYNNEQYKEVIFCEGYRAISNPLFQWLPFSVTKGQIISVKMKGFPEDHIVNKGFFILPHGQDQFLVGSSYELTTEEGLSEKGRDQVIRKLEDLITCDYEVVDQKAAIRPTVRDRRPFIGTHPEYSNVHIFNGLGTKGVSLGPYFCQQLKKYLLEGEKLDDSVNIERYFSLFYSSASD